MSNRSVWKGPYVQGKLLKRANVAIQKKDFRIIKTWARNSVIIPIFTGLTFAVHNGKNFVPIEIKEVMVGKKIGEFVPTRRFKSHGTNKK